MKTLSKRLALEQYLGKDFTPTSKTAIAAERLTDYQLDFGSKRAALDRLQESVRLSVEHLTGFEIAYIALQVFRFLDRWTLVSSDQDILYACNSILFKLQPRSHLISDAWEEQRGMTVFDKLYTRVHEYTPEKGLAATASRLTAVDDEVKHEAFEKIWRDLPGENLLLEDMEESLYIYFQVIEFLVALPKTHMDYLAQSAAVEIFKSLCEINPFLPAFNDAFAEIEKMRQAKKGKSN